jgi:hypothetical protein
MFDVPPNPKILKLPFLEITMLRKIISLYKAVFLLICCLMLATILLLGIFVMIEGQTPA